MHEALERELALVLAVMLSGGLVVLTAPEAKATRVLRTAPVVYLGRISYSLYLWHWLVMVVFKWTIGFTASTVRLTLGLAAGLAHLSHRFIEQPLRHGSWARTRRREYVVALAPVCMVGIALVGIVKAPDKTLYLGAPLVMEAIGGSSLTEPYVSVGGTIWAGEACILSTNAEVGTVLPLEACVVGNPPRKADKRLLIIGNSFSAAFVQTFDKLGEHEPELGSVSAIVTSSWGASIAPGVANDGPWDEANDYYWAKVVPALVADLSPGDRVMIMSDIAELSPMLTAEAGEVRSAAQRRDAAMVGLRAFAKTLSAREIELTVLGPLPFMRDANCAPEQLQAQWFSPKGGVTCTFLTREETLARLAPTRQMLEMLEVEGTLRVLDLFDYFCDDGLCDYFDASGKILYRDVYSHPSEEAARTLRKPLAWYLRQP
jgi:hypothetical protein